MKNVKNSKILIIAAVLIAALAVQTVVAYSVEIKKNRNDFIKEFTGKSPEYLIIEKGVDRELLSGYEIESRIAEIERQIKASEDRIKDYDNNYYGLDHVVLIDTETINGFELQTTKAQLEMQLELFKLYEKYSEQIREQQENGVKYKILQKLNAVKTYETMLNYLETVVNLREKELEVETARLNEGYSKQSDVDRFSAALATAKSERDVCQIEYNALMFELKQNIKDVKTDFDLDYSPILSANYDEYITDFKKSDYQKDYVKEELPIYEDYMKKLSEISEKLIAKNIKSKTLYKSSDKDVIEYYDRVLNNINSAIKYYENEIEIKKLSETLYTQNLELYVFNLCGQYNSLLSRLSAVDSEITAAKSQANVVSALFEQGRVIEIEVLSAESAVVKLEYEKIQILSQLDGIGWVLENGVYVQ